MATDIKMKEGKAFWDFVRETAAEVSTWREFREPDPTLPQSPAPSRTDDPKERTD